MTEFEHGTPRRPDHCCGSSPQQPRNCPSELASLSPEELQRLVETLQASHRELELQNDAMRRLQRELETSRECLEHRAAERTALADRRARQLRHLASQLTRVEQRERRRLAQVLHDHLQQQLVAVRLKLNAICRRTEDLDILRAIGEADALVNESIDASRGLTYDLSPPILHDAGLNVALQWLARWKHEKHGLAVDVRTDRNAEPTDESMRILVFQVVRELLFNVVKHAQTARARVELSRQGDQVQVVVSDEGVGFDPAELNLSAMSAHGFGLSSVHERLELMGGKLDIDAAPGRGARITVRAPLASPRAETDGDPRSADP